MISVIIPTLDAQRELAATLTALVPASVEGIVREVIIVDGGSSDATLRIADEAGVKILSSSGGRGPQLATGGREARGPWLLFLHADTVLDPSWTIDAEQFMRRSDNRGAAAFRFTLDERGFMPGLMEFMVGLRSTWFKLPYGDQGLLIKKSFYDELGGFGPLPLMEDVEFVGRIGRRRMHMLGTRAVTSASRYVEHGYARRIICNLTCLTRYLVGQSPEKIARIYEKKRSKMLARKGRDDHR